MSNIKDAIRNVWANNVALTAVVPVSGGNVNRFFEDDVPEIPEGATDFSYVSVTDFGTAFDLRSSNGSISSGNLLVVIGTNSKQVTEQLYLDFKADLESDLRGTVTDVGSIGDFVFQSLTFQRTPNGFFECQFNLELTQSEA